MSEVKFVREASTITWSIIKSSLCPEGAEPNVREGYRRACEWLATVLPVLTKISTPTEIQVLDAIVHHWQAHGETPSLKLLRMGALTVGDAQLQAGLDEFEEASGQVEHHDPEALPSLLDLRVRRDHDETIARRMKIAQSVALKGLTIKRGGVEIRLQGARDAMAYAMEGFDAWRAGQGDQPTRCSTAPGDTTLSLLWDAAMSPDDRDRIHTGLSKIDENVPLRKGQLVGVLAHAGQGKSTLARTVLYNAAMDGASVLVIPLELEVEEEVAALAVIHALRQFPTQARRLDVTKAAQYQRRLTEDARRWMTDVVKPDFLGQFDGQDGRGLIRIARPSAMTIEAVITLIDQEHTRHALDMVVIDYPGCLRLPGKNTRQEGEDMVSRLKDLAAHFDDGHRLLVLCPIQSNRAGWEAAKKNGGAFEMNAALEVSAWERYCDLVLGVFRDDDLDAEGKAILSTPKVRNGAPIPQWTVKSDRAARYFHDVVVDTTADLTLNDVMDDLP